MQIEYLRSSSYSTFDFCQMQYFISYVLGVPNPAGKAAAKGSCVHKVMEIVANCKKVMQDNPDLQTYTYDKFSWTTDEFLQPEILSDTDILAINKTRINKYNYKHECKLKSGHIRYGTRLVNSIIEECIGQFENVGDVWANADVKDCENWSWMAMEYRDGMFDPRRMNIIQAEQRFELDFWKNFQLKGTIDLITSPRHGILEVVDLKTGSRVDWNSSNPSKNPKTYIKLCNDLQLMLYYYVVKRLYPDASQVLVTIFWVRDGGPYTMCFDDQTAIELEKKLRTRFSIIENCTNPKLQDPSQSNFKCTKLCNYYKMASPDGSTNFCRFIHDVINEKGIDEVTKLYQEKDFSIGYYEAPG